MSQIFIAGFVSCLVVMALAAMTWAMVGPLWGLTILISGYTALVAYHLWHLYRLARWAAGPVDAVVPEARGPWRVGFSALYQRVRSRTAHQRDLAHTIDRFRRAADAIPDGMVVLDARDRVRWANRRAQLHLGLVPEQDTGRPIANLVRQPEVVRYLTGGDYSDSLVVESQRESGVTLSIQIVPFGEHERLLISRDITKLQAVERMRRDFIANVSHELKTPLTVVSGFLETLRELDLDIGQQRRFLDLMQEQSRNMQRLVDDLLTLSTLESNANHVADAPFAIGPLVQEIAAEARALSLGAHEITVKTGPAAQVIGSRDELRSAFANLVSNAVRYTPAGGPIALEWRIDDLGAGVFSVTDGGIGISAEHIPRLTERFYRVDRSRSRATGGTGLGLAIVKHVLIRHEAELVIESEPEKGSTFSVRLPPNRVGPMSVTDDIPTIHAVTAARSDDVVSASADRARQQH